MTTPKPETIEREKDKLYVTDAELFRRLGVPAQTARMTILHLEAKAGFPRKQQLFANRRYWPAVEAWLDKHNGLTVAAPQNRRAANDR